MAFPKFGEIKPTLIDLEAQQWATGRKLKEHRERLNELAPLGDAIVRAGG